MSLANKLAEVHRLLKGFEVEAAKFHDLRLSTFFVAQDGANSDRIFHSINHVVMLWQFYGSVGANGDITHLMQSVKESDSKFGLRGAELTSFAVIEGDMCELFIRMANRAGSIFDEDEAREIKSRVVNELLHRERADDGSRKPVAAVNENPLAIWINYLLYHLSITNPGREHAAQIALDPFSLSLLALERLASDQTIEKTDRSNSNVSEVKFKVAVSFPGEKRVFVSHVVDALRPKLGADAVFYDYDYQAQLARPNLDTLLQDIYRNRSELLVVFLCVQYSEKEWCGLEWRAIRDIVKSKQDERVMFVRFDDSTVDGVFSIDGYIDATTFTPTQVADFVVERLAELPEIKSKLI